MSGSGRPVHLRARSVVLVFVGGALGTAARDGLGRVVPDLRGVPLAILAVNVVGAFVLGLLLQRLLHAGSDTGRRRDLRLFAGTGLLGGFTTYSALAVDTTALLTDGHPGRAAAYALATLFVGAMASVAGIWCAGSGRRPSSPADGTER